MFAGRGSTGLFAIFLVIGSSCNRARFADTTQTGIEAAHASKSAPLAAADAHEAAKLRTRAHQYWKARQDQNWAELYEFEVRSIMSRIEAEDFIQQASHRQPFHVRSFELTESDTEQTWGWAKVRYESVLPRFPAIPPRQVEVWQKWHRVDGQWYPVPAERLTDYPEPRADRNAVEENALRRCFLQSCELRRTGNWSRLYEWCDPPDRPAVPPEEFAKSQSLTEYLGHELEWVEVIGDHGRVRVAYRHRLTDPSLTKLPPTTEPVIEHWVKRDNRWYRDMIRP